MQAALDRYDELNGSIYAGNSDISATNLTAEITETLNYFNFCLFKVRIGSKIAWRFKLNTRLIFYPVFLQQGNIERALTAVNRWLELEPGAQPGADNLVWYEKSLNESGVTYDPDNLPPLTNERIKRGHHTSDAFANYEQLCRNEPVVSIAVILSIIWHHAGAVALLSCSYNNKLNYKFHYCKCSCSQTQGALGRTIIPTWTSVADLQPDAPSKWSLACFHTYNIHIVGLYMCAHMYVFKHVCVPLTLSYLHLV